jgi:hypothetical protein
MELVIAPDGHARAIYGEAIDLRALGPLAIVRASHVEPTPDGRWSADLRLVRGPVLGPFAQRSQALEAEHQWLRAHWLVSGSLSR